MIYNLATQYVIVYMARTSMGYDWDMTGISRNIKTINSRSN